MKKRILSAALAAAMMLGSISVSASLDDVNYKDWSNLFWTDTADTLDGIPPQYSFTLNDDTADTWGKTPIYQVLDTETVNGKTNVLIIRLGSIAARAKVSTKSTSESYDPEEEGTLGYWMDNIWTGEQKDTTYEQNNGGILNAEGTHLNSKFKDYLVEHSWVMEKCSKLNIAENTTITAKAVIPSASELNYYVHNKIGNAAIAVGSGMEAALTRTLKEATESGVRRLVYALGSQSNGMLCMQPLNINSGDMKRAWGMFWVSEDFFKNVKLSGMGNDVMSIVAENNTEEELYALGYTVADLVAMGKVDSSEIPENVTAKVEKAVPGYKVSVTVDGNAATASTDIKWYVSDSENGTYALIDGASGNNWAITNACANKYIKANVKGVYSNAIAVGGGLKTFQSVISGGWTVPSDMPDESPAEYMFELANPSTNKGYTYHMLKSEEVNGENQYFILQMGEMISNGKLMPTSTEYRFDPSVAKSAAAWLNEKWAVASDPNDSSYYAGNGGVLNDNASAIDTNIKNYLQNHTWLTERSGTTITDDYTYTGKVSILSVNELLEHYKKIGKDDYGSCNWLRTSTDVNSGGLCRMYENSNNGTWYWGITTGTDRNYVYRPVYYLSEDFFKNVKLSSIGAEAAKTVRATITKAEMLSGSAGYTEDELIEIFGYSKDINTYTESAVIAGETAVGQRVLARFDGVSDGAEYQWYIANSNDGEYEAVSGATDKAYVIKSSDLGKYLAVTVTAYNGNGEKLAPISAKADSAVAAEKDLTVRFAALKANGTAVESISGQTALTAEFTIKANSANSKATLILAVYDVNGNLIAVNTNPLNSIEVGEQTYSVPLTGIDTNKAYSCKAMAWSDMELMQPLCADERF